PGAELLHTAHVGDRVSGDGAVQIHHEPVEAVVAAGAEVLDLGRGGGGDRLGQRPPADPTVRRGRRGGRGDGAQPHPQRARGEGGQASLLHGCLLQETAKATAARAV